MKNSRERKKWSVLAMIAALLLSTSACELKETKISSNFSESSMSSKMSESTENNEGMSTNSEATSTSEIMTDITSSMKNTSSETASETRESSTESKSETSTEGITENSTESKPENSSDASEEINLNAIFTEISTFAHGTAGSSLQAASISANFLKYISNENLNPEQFSEEVKMSYENIPAEQKDAFKNSFEELKSVILGLANQEKRYLGDLQSAGGSLPENLLHADAVQGYLDQVDASIA